MTTNKKLVNIEILEPFIDENSEIKKEALKELLKTGIFDEIIENFEKQKKIFEHIKKLKIESSNINSNFGIEYDDSWEIYFNKKKDEKINQLCEYYKLFNIFDNIIDDIKDIKRKPNQIIQDIKNSKTINDLNNINTYEILKNSKIEFIQLLNNYIQEIENFQIGSIEFSKREELIEFSKREESTQSRSWYYLNSMNNLKLIQDVIFIKYRYPYVYIIKTNNRFFIIDASTNYIVLSHQYNEKIIDISIGVNSVQIISYGNKSAFWKIINGSWKFDSTINNYEGRYTQLKIQNTGYFELNNYNLYKNGNIIEKDLKCDLLEYCGDYCLCRKKE
jgi:hypothetical protein